VTDGGLGIGEGGIDTTLPIAEVRELIVTLGKALRASQLYDENNPVYKRFVEALTASFTAVLAKVGELALFVEENRLTLEGEEVYASSNRSESIAFLLYKDGVRAVQFAEGFETQVPRFLDVLNRARHARQDDDDLLTLLWEADLDHFKHRFVNMLAEGVSLPEAGMGATASELTEAVAEARQDEEEGDQASGEAGQEPPTGTVSRDDFNPTLYALDASEMEELRRAVRAERERDVRADVLAALFDRFEDGSAQRRGEIFDILDGLIPAFLARGEIAAATRVLQQMRSYEQAEGLGEGGRQRIGQLLDRISSPETLEQLLEALEVGTIAATGDDLGAFLGFLRGGALGVLLRGALETESKELERILGEAVEAIARKNAQAVTDLLASPDPAVLAAAARIVGQQRIESAAGGLRDLLYNGDARVRSAAVEAVGALRVSTLMGPLVETLLDPEIQVRISAARVLGGVRYQPAASRFREILDSKEIRQADRQEKIAFFEAYGRLGDARAVDILDGYLNGKGFLGRRESSEIRASAALGLGRVGTDEARAALARAERDDDAVVRSAVTRALTLAEQEGA